MQVTISEIVMQFPARSPSEHLAVYVDNLAPGFVPAAGFGRSVILGLLRLI